MKSRPIFDVVAVHNEIRLQLETALRNTPFKTQRALAWEAGCDPSVVTRVFNSETPTRIKKLLPMLIRSGGFKSREAVNRLLRLYEQILSEGQVAKLLVAVNEAWNEVDLPDHAPM